MGKIITNFDSDSNICLSYDDIFGVPLRTLQLEEVGYHCFRLVDKLRFGLLLILSKLLRNDAVTIPCLGNDEIQKDDICEEQNNHEHYPEE